MMQVKSFDPGDVTLTGGPLRHAQDLNADYLLRLEPDRLLSRFREYAGLEPKAPPYGGWESTGVSGHTLGHYLSALSRMAVISKDVCYRERVGYVLQELAECQAAHGDGYVGAIPDGRRVFGELRQGVIRSKGFDLNGGWVPFYTLHKLLAGLRDAHRLTDSAQALEIGRLLGEWMLALLSLLPEAQMQEILKCEFGGMNEVLADLVADAGDGRFLALSKRFDHQALYGPLAEGRDELAGLHANTQIPKIVGAARQYELTGEERYRRISEFFWHTVVHSHSYAIGGNSYNEHFGEPKRLAFRIGAGTCETCNSYNMLKLTGYLFQWNALAELGDYSERVLYNHILASQHPGDGRVCYCVSLDMGGYKDYNSQFGHFTCCVGSGMENHTLYGSGLYYRGDRTLFVNQFAPSAVSWREMGVVATQETDFPANGKIAIHLECRRPVSFRLNVRRPYWAGEGVTAAVNGEEELAMNGQTGFLSIERVWRDGDRVELEFPMTVRTEAMPDKPNRIALMYGPLVLAGDLGEAEGAAAADRPGAGLPPVFVTDAPLEACIRPKSGEPLMFRSEGAGRPQDVQLRPFYLTHDRRYTVYWDRFTEAEWAAEEKAYREAARAARELERLTVDFVQPGEMQPERDHNFQGELTHTGTFAGRKYRDAWLDGWFAFDLSVLPEEPLRLVVMYAKETEAIARFGLWADDSLLEPEREEEEEGGRFIRISYPLSPQTTAGMSRITVRFAACPGCKVPKVFAIRTARVGKGELR